MKFKLVEEFDLERSNKNYIAERLGELIVDEYEAIKGYEQMLYTLHDMQGDGTKNIDIDGFIRVIKDINNEEHVHVGQLQEALKTVSDAAHDIEKGEKEGKGQLKK